MTETVIRKVRKTYDSAILPLSGMWHKHQDARPNRIGLTLQNQNLLANFWVADCAKLRLTDAQWYAPGTGTIEDLYADQGEIWVYTDTPGAALTVIEKFLG